MADGSSVKVDGVWDCVTQSPMGEQKTVLTIRSTPDGRFTGTNAGALGSLDVAGEVNGAQIRFKMEITLPFPMTLDCACSVEGDAMTGTVTVGAFGSYPMNATRRS